MDEFDSANMDEFDSANMDEFGRVNSHGRIRMNTIFPDFWENLEHAQTVCTRLSFPPTPLIQEPGYEGESPGRLTCQ